MALVWLFSSQIPLALLPFTVYSVFHVATYTRTNLIPTIQPSPSSPATGASPGSRSSIKSNSPLAEQIGRFVKGNYDGSMMLVAILEISLWWRVLFSAIILSNGSWILLSIYSVFLRSRYSQNTFVQNAIAQASARVDALVSGQGIPPAIRQGWQTVKRVARQATDATDVTRYLGGQGVGGKKVQ